MDARDERVCALLATESHLTPARDTKNEGGKLEAEVTPVPDSDSSQHDSDNASLIDPASDNSMESLKSFVTDFPMSWIPLSSDLATSPTNSCPRVCDDFVGLELVLGWNF